MCALSMGFEAVAINGLAPYMCEESRSSPDREEEFLPLFEDVSRTLCAWCGRWRNSDGSWEIATNGLGDNATHGICPECLASEMCKGVDEI